MPITVQSRPADTLSRPRSIGGARYQWRLPGCQQSRLPDRPCDTSAVPVVTAARLFGRAVTALREPPDFGAVLQALDLIQPGDVLVIAANGHAETAMIGEILGGHLRRLGGRGIVCDGAIRDVAQLAEWPELPAFARSITPRGPSSMERGVVNATVTIGGLLVSPGDLIIGDDDGLAALSPDAIRSYIGAAEAKLALEDAWQRASPTGARSRRPLGCLRA